MRPLPRMDKLWGTQHGDKDLQAHASLGILSPISHLSASEVCGCRAGGKSQHPFPIPTPYTHSPIHPYVPASTTQPQKIDAAIAPLPKPWSQLCKAGASFSALLSLTDASEPGAAVKVTRFSNSL